MAKAKVNIQDLLYGCQPGEIQTVGNMAIIPLVSEVIDRRFSPPDNLEVATSHYGTMEVKNPSRGGSGEATILPTGAGYIVKQSAQDHATCGAKVIPANKVRKITTAACIQQSQGGTISSGKHEMTILPFSLKEDAFKLRNQKEYGKLWPAIKQFNQTLSLPSRGHLEDYYKKYAKELDQFVAEFEIVANQVGAVILIDGKVVGIERAPNYEFWNAVWKPLIRECYGSRSLQEAKSRGLKVPETRVPLKAGRKRSLSGIKQSLVEANREEDKLVKDTVRGLIKKEFAVKSDDKPVAGFAVEQFDAGQFKGQVVRDEDIIIYLSAFTTQRWLDDPKVAAHARADKFDL